AELSGFRINPSGFTNALTITGNMTGINFAGTAATVAPIIGRITRQGLPLAGVTVQANQGSSTLGSAISDSDGYYRIQNLANGSSTALPRRASSSFSPATQTVGSVPTSGINFTATGPTAPPVISLLTANPPVVPNLAGTATLSVTASGSGTLSYS